MSPTSVTIIGLGYGGIVAAKALDGNENINLTCIEAREGFFLHKWGALRAASAGKMWIDRVLIPTDKMLKRSRIVHAFVEEVDDVNKTVRCNTGEIIHYDILIIAVGARNFSIGEPPMSITTRVGMQQHFEKARALIAKSKSIIVVGAGPVACELVGELKAYTNASTKIAICTGDEMFLAHVNPPLKKSAQKSIRTMLEKSGVEIIQGDCVVSPPIPSLEQGKYEMQAIMETCGGGVTFASGKKRNCDLILFATGNIVSTSFLPSKWVDSMTKEIKVDKYLRVMDTVNVFALGDAANTYRTKLGVLAMADGDVVARNVIRMVDGKIPSTTMPASRSDITLSFGDKSGKTFILPFFTLGGGMTAAIKSKGLFAGLLWDTITGDEAPSPSPRATQV